MPSTHEELFGIESATDESPWVTGEGINHCKTWEAKLISAGDIYGSKFLACVKHFELRLTFFPEGDIPQVGQLFRLEQFIPQMRGEAWAKELIPEYCYGTAPNLPDMIGVGPILKQTVLLAATHGGIDIYRSEQCLTPAANHSANSIAFTADLYPVPVKAVPGSS